MLLHYVACVCIECLSVIPQQRLYLVPQTDNRCHERLQEGIAHSAAKECVQEGLQHSAHKAAAAATEPAAQVQLQHQGHQALV